MDREARILFNAILMVDDGINRELAIKLATQMVELMNREAELVKRVADLKHVLRELRIRYHSSGRRPEECYEMSIIDAALAAVKEEGLDSYVRK